MSDLELTSATLAEQAVLGAILCDPATAMGHLLDAGLRAEEFAQPFHQRCYRAMQAMHDAGAAIDVVTLLDHLTRDTPLTDDLRAYVRDHLDTQPTAHNVAHHVAIVREAHLRRTVAAVGQSLAAAATDRRYSVEQVVDDAERTLHAARPTERARILRGRDVLRTMMEEFEQRRDNPASAYGIPTGLPSLDAMTLGLQRSNLTILAARPSVGKSALAATIALAAAEAGHRVFVFTLEMTAAQTMQRMAAQWAGIPLMGLRRGSLHPAETKRLHDAVAAIARMRIGFDQTGGLAIGDLRGRARRAAVGEPIDMIVVDYLQLCTAPGENRNVQVGAISGGLKSLAKDLHCNVLALAQLTRANERENRRPVLSDLRDSGSIEQDADDIAFLHRPALDALTAELIVAKQRQGPLGVVRLAFDAQTTRYRELPAMEAAA